MCVIIPLTMVVRMRSTRSHTGNRRSHHALANPALSKDSKTGVVHLRHIASAETGTYKGRPVKSLQKKLERTLKRTQAKTKKAA
jgi:ribosomal protein L32